MLMQSSMWLRLYMEMMVMIIFTENPETMFYTVMTETIIFTETTEMTLSMVEPGMTIYTAMLITTHSTEGQAMIILKAEKETTLLMEE